MPLTPRPTVTSKGIHLLCQDVLGTWIGVDERLSLTSPTENTVVLAALGHGQRQLPDVPEAAPAGGRGWWCIDL